MMARIAEATEESLLIQQDKFRMRRPEAINPNLAQSIAYSTVLLARDLDATLIIAPTDSGDTPRRIVRHRPRQPVLALSTSEQTVRRLALSRGVIPWKIPRRMPLEKILASVRERLIADDLGNEGEFVVLSAGYPFGAKVNKGRLIQTEVI
jgi:pyruvate kinase